MIVRMCPALTTRLLVEFLEKQSGLRVLSLANCEVFPNITDVSGSEPTETSAQPDISGYVIA